MKQKDIERFFRRVDRLGADDACWIWVGGVGGSGYGNICFMGSYTNAHRASWRMFRGEVPLGMHVLHSCNVKLCVNPEHLYLGSREDNIQDALRDGLMKVGERHPMAKLTEKQVLRIRDDQRKHGIIAADYGVSRSLIGLIKQHKVWKNVGRNSKRSK